MARRERLTRMEWYIKYEFNKYNDDNHSNRISQNHTYTTPTYQQTMDTTIDQLHQALHVPNGGLLGIREHHDSTDHHTDDLG
jgi:hypothetical protein